LLRTFFICWCLQMLNSYRIGHTFSTSSTCISSSPRSAS
jgi:hypothetical protein